MLRGANETGKRISPVIKMPVLAVITALIFRPLGRRGFESLRPLQTISGLGKHASVGSSGAFCFLGPYAGILGLPSAFKRKRAPIGALRICMRCFFTCLRSIPRRASLE